MKLQKYNYAIISTLLLALSTTSSVAQEKVTLKGNMKITYNKLPSSTQNISEIFTNGMFYGRLRANTFYYDWTAEDKNSGAKDNRAMGLGGSFIYKTAPYSGFSATAGLYTSQNPNWYNASVADLATVKSGKDTYSRNDTKNTGNFGMSVLGQAYLQYSFSKTDIIAGRQLFESVFTASNDTKMIPNTFDGVSITSKDIPNTKIVLAYFNKQKLRDHTQTHDVIAFSGWNQNDDSSANKNLTVEKIGDNNSLSIASIKNNSIKNFDIKISGAMVPDVLSDIAVDASYLIPITKDIKIVPAIRYIQQMDNLNSDTPVANLSASSTVGYKDPNSLDSSLFAARLDIKTSALLVRFGYSAIDDKADIIAPWRGFPTGGFTRAMAQYNWRANTKSYMAKVSYDFGKAKILDGFKLMARYAIQDFDDKKDEVQADSNVLHIDAIENITKSLQAKLRVGFAQAKNDTLKSDGITYKKDVSYNEYRFELNYLF